MVVELQLLLLTKCSSRDCSNKCREKFLFHSIQTYKTQFHLYQSLQQRIRFLNSLVEAKLDLRADRDGEWAKTHRDYLDPMNLINGLKNVQILDLTIDIIEMFGVFQEAIPVFENLFQISLCLSEFHWLSLPILIKKSPNLKTLIIEDCLHYGEREDGYLCECVSEYSFLMSCSVEILKINSYNGSIKELTQIKHFLEKLTCLELVEVNAR